MELLAVAALVLQRRQKRGSTEYTKALRREWDCCCRTALLSRPTLSTHAFPSLLRSACFPRRSRRLRGSNRHGPSRSLCCNGRVDCGYPVRRDPGLGQGHLHVSEAKTQLPAVSEDDALHVNRPIPFLEAVELVKVKPRRFL